MGSIRAFFLLLLLAAAPAAAQRHMQVELVAERAEVPPAGRVRLAFVMRPERGWHGYWRNPGDAGAAPRVQWTLPEGWRVSELRYPVPSRLDVAGLTNYVFEGEHALLATLEASAFAEPGVVFPIDARIDYVVCTDRVCVPETATVSVDLATVRAPPPQPRATTPTVAEPNAPPNRVREAERKLPQSLERLGGFAIEGDRIRFSMWRPPNFTHDRDLWFFPVNEDAIAHSAPQTIGFSGDRIIIETRIGRGARSLRMVEGVLRYGPGRGIQMSFVPASVPVAQTIVAGAPGQSGGGAGGPGLLAALLGALIGGLILNVMPCVFPILSLKALGLARAGASEKDARAEALAYAAGVIATCLALGAVLLSLRAGGAAVGWAFQLQDPRVILILLLLVTAIALSLAGLFRLPMLGVGDRLAQRGGAAGAFFTGALAAFIATPCTGPFMGAALGAALVLPASGSLAVFGGLGLGLALPFLLIGFVPALRRRLPRPGPWMETLQRILSVPMFLTALGLAWVLGRQTGADGMALGLLAALTLGLALWWVGRGGRWFAGLLALLAALPILILPTAPTATAPTESPLPAEPFSEARLSQLRAAGTPVFLYFTADWCLTCKVNERGALASAAVADSFRQSGVRVMVGDWTRGDPAIGRFLASQGRSGVPLYLYYPRGGGEPQVLPQLLTASRLTSLVR